ncbi:hypothetical protein ZWY2020_007120 [Hordeum vulgare]|nr:hypothetical protein ZWY2020_007120 [Hordeum vulgare]
MATDSHRRLETHGPTHRFPNSTACTGAKDPVPMGTGLPPPRSGPAVARAPRGCSGGWLGLEPPNRHRRGSPREEESSEGIPGCLSLRRIQIKLGSGCHCHEMGHPSITKNRLPFHNAD